MEWDEKHPTIRRRWMLTLKTFFYLTPPLPLPPPPPKKKKLSSKFEFKQHYKMHNKASKITSTYFEQRLFTRCFKQICELREHNGYWQYEALLGHRKAYIKVLWHISKTIIRSWRRNTLIVTWNDHSWWITMKLLNPLLQRLINTLKMFFYLASVLMPLAVKENGKIWVAISLCFLL